MKKTWLAVVRPSSDRRWVFLALAICMVAAAPKVAHAQIVPAAPVRETVDANGVDLFSGKLTVTGPPLVLGSEGNSLSFYRWNKGSGWTDNLMAFMNLTGSVMTVSLGGVSDSFVISAYYSPTEANGSMLTYNSTSKIYTYVSHDGSVAHFDKNALSEYVPYSNNGMILDIVSPRGEKRTFAYEFITYCKVPGASGQFCAQTAKAYRVSSVTSSYGFQLVPSYEPYEWFYDSTDPYSQPDFAIYSTVIGVSARNLAVSATTPIASQSFSYVPSGGITNYIVTDAVGRQTKYRVGTGGVVAGITYPSHSSEDVTFAYSGGVVTSIARAGAGTTTYSRSDSGNVRTVTVTPPTASPVISATVYAFDIPMQRMTSVTVTENSINRTVTYAYDSNGRLTRTTMPEGNYVQLTRDSRGNVTETRAVGKPLSGVTDIVTSAGFDPTCSYPARCNQPNWTKDAKNNQTDYTYDLTHGGVLTVTLPAADASGIRPQTRYGYTWMQAYYYNGGSIVASGQQVARMTSVSNCRTTASCAGGTDERKTTIYYGPQTGVGNNLNLLSSTIHGGDVSLDATSTFTYDAIGNVATVDGPQPSTVDQTMMAYNLARQLLWKIGPDPDVGGTALFPAVAYTYRPDGQVDFVQSGTVTTQSPSGMSSFAELQRQTVGYDTYNRPNRQQLSSGVNTYQVTDLRYDAAGRVQCSMLRMNPVTWGSPPSDCSPTLPTGSNGPDRATYNSYDALSRVWKLTTGYGTTDAADEQIVTFTGNGRADTVKDAENNLTTYQYDGHDRRVKTLFPVTTKGAAQSSTTDFERVTYDANSNVATFTTRRAETLRYTYDNLDRLVLKVVPERSGLTHLDTRDVYFGYDLFGDMTYARFDSASGEGITNTFDSLGQLSTSTNNMDATSRPLSYLYDVVGNLIELTHPDGTHFTYVRNAAGALDQINLSTATPLLKPILDAAGRLNRLDRWRTLTSDWLARTTVGYDSASRVASLFTDLNGTTRDTTTNFTYNPASQIATTGRNNDAYHWTGQANVDRPYVSDGLNRYGTVGSATYGYDANGNLTGDGTNAFVYDLENRLVLGSGSVALRYDPLGRLYEVVKGTATRRFLYDGSDLVAEYNASGTLLRRYVHGLGGGDDPLVWFEGATTGDSARRNLYADERGSIVAVTDSAGTTLNVNSYDEYGTPGSANVGTFQYTGQVWLPELGMYYYKARMYSPLLGRFMQTDPIGYGGGMNMYAYAGNDPSNGVDPSGTDTCYTRAVDNGYTLELTHNFMENWVVMDQQVQRCYFPVTTTNGPGPWSSGYAPTIQQTPFPAMGWGSSTPTGGVPCGSNIDDTTFVEPSLLGFIKQEGLNVLSRTADVVGGAGMVLGGAAACATGAGCVGGAPLGTLGLSSIQEGWTGEPGFVRSAATSALGTNAGNITVDVINVGTSVSGLFGATLRSNSWKLFHNISSDFVAAYRTMTKTGLSVEIGGTVLGAAATTCSYIGK